MALRHAKSGDIINVRPLGDRLRSEKSQAYFKSKDLELIRLVYCAGDVFQPHEVAGEIIIQCIEGRIEVSSDRDTKVITAGDLIFLEGHVPHGLRALEDSSALLTISLR